MEKFNRKKLYLFLSLIHLSFFLILGVFPSFFAHSSAEESGRIFPIVPFSADEIAIDDAYKAPTWHLDEHFLGTDNLGRDILAGIIYGCQTSIMVSFPSMILSSIIGVLLGLLSGYFGNYSKKISLVSVIFIPIACLLCVFYGFYLRQFIITKAFEENLVRGIGQIFMSVLIVLFIISISVVCKNLLKRYTRQKVIGLPIDEVILKLTELFSSVPRFILIVSLSAFARPSLQMLVFIIGFTSWAGMTRLLRAEILKIKAMQFVESGKAMGLSDRQILLKHILPNAIPPVIVAFTFGLANLLALEATLSFLNIGLPPDFVSWGKIIAGVRYNLSAWWLVVFPGIYLSLTVMALHNCSNYIMDKISVKE